MANFEILTNNRAVGDAFPAVSRVLEGTVERVLIAVRDAVHLGAVLISHPLSGSVKPNESPFKSVVLSMRRGEVDARSLLVIEDALTTLRKLPKRHMPSAERVLGDYAAIDLSLVRSALSSLPSAYHE